MAAIGPQPKYAGEDQAALIKDLNRLPLFMTELDTTDGDGGSNLALEALQALAYEGTPLEVASNFKTQGNECFQAKLYKDAVEYYTKAIAASTNQDAKQETTNDEKAQMEAIFDAKADSGARISIPVSAAEEEADARALEEVITACYLNRAACNLELKNYRRVLNDCAQVLKKQPRNAKAYYRSARACLAIDKLEDAHECIERGLEIEPRSSSFKDLAVKVFQREDYLLKVEQQQTFKVPGKKHVVKF